LFTAYVGPKTCFVSPCHSDCLFVACLLNVRHCCRYETARLDSGVAQRPVLRLQGGIVLTRIDPSVKETSMIMRIRPGWDALRAFLAPDPKGK